LGWGDTVRKLNIETAQVDDKKLIFWTTDSTQVEVAVID
jgi:hypothetical protein